MPDDFMDVLVPAFPGFRYIGNGENDAVDQLRDQLYDDDGLTRTEIDDMLVDWPPRNPLDEIAFRHDVGTIDPATGEPRDTLGRRLSGSGRPRLLDPHDPRAGAGRGSLRGEDGTEPGRRILRLVSGATNPRIGKAPERSGAFFRFGCRSN